MNKLSLLFTKSINKIEQSSLWQKEESSQPQTSCPACEFKGDAAAFIDRLCPTCGHHLRMGARQRLNLVLDEGSFEEKDANLTSLNFLDFPGYDEKLAKATKASGELEAVLTGTGEISGLKTAIFAMDPNFMMGSMGSVVGEKITRLFEYAEKEGLPVIGFCTSGGARMQEGVTSLVQMAKTSAAIHRHSQAGLLYVSVLCDPTTGGVTASFARLADIILAEPQALIGFAGPRVIESTIRKKLPEGFQRAETVLNQGFLDQIVNRRNIKAYLRRLLSLHGGV